MTPTMDASCQPRRTLVSPLEATRVIASAPEIDQRFSYRYVASQLAEAAANLLPPRSHAYAETLCWAALFARRDRARVDALYARYIRNGAEGFGGESCEEPDFHRARTFDDDQHLRAMRTVLRAERARAWTWARIRAAAWRHKSWIAIPLVSLGLLLVVQRRYRTLLGAL